MDWGSVKDLSKRWCSEGIQYAEKVKAFVQKGEEEGWDNIGDEPIDTRTDIAKQVLDIVYEANKATEIQELRKYFPPAFPPFINMYDDISNCIDSLFILDDGRIVFREGTYLGKKTVHIVSDNGYHEVLNDVVCIGRSPNRKYFALTFKDCVKVYDGFNGKLKNSFKLPTGKECLLDDMEYEEFNGAKDIINIIPFPEGDRVILISPRGIYALEKDEIIYLQPDEEFMNEVLYHQREDEVFSMELDMMHGAISEDGKYIALGYQDSNHIILDNEYNEVASIYPDCSYPHYAMFSKDGKYVAFNSCHFYNGVTISVPLETAITNDEDKINDEIIEIDDTCRVYAGVARKDEYIIGDANGYIYSIKTDGTKLWKYYIGGTISRMDISEDGGKLVVGTYAGMVHLINLDIGATTPYTIGNGKHTEKCRWLVWKDQILRW